MDKVVPALLGLIFFGVGLTLRWSDFGRALSYRKAFFYAAACQYILFPLICFGVCALIKPPPNVSIGIMIIAFCPSASTSNIYTFIFKGDTAFSISLTAISAVITPFVLPFMIKLSSQYFYGDGQQLELPIAKTILQGLGLVLAPMLLGMWFRRVNLMFARWSKRPFEILSSLIIMFILVGLAMQFRKFFTNLEYAVPISLLLLALALGLGVLSRLLFNFPERIARTISFEVCLQNGATGVFIIFNLLKRPEFIAGLGTYSVLMIFTGYVWGYYLDKKVPINRYQRAIA